MPKLTLTPWTKFKSVPPLIIHKLHMKFESDWTKTVVCIVPQCFIDRVPKVDLFNMVPPLNMHNSHMKFESDWAKTVACIVSTRFYRQSSKFDLDL